MARSESADCPECGGSGWRARDADGVRRVDRCGCWRRQVTRTMNLVVNIRYNDDRPIIFTSNYEDAPHTDSR